MDFLETAQQRFGSPPADELRAGFDLLESALLDWNTRVNLTAITDPQEVRLRHFLDSLSLLPCLGETRGKRLIDVGTGAGFPGLPLAMARPDLQVTLLEATGKKLAFIDEVARTLKLKNVRTLHARAEEAGQMPGERESYDYVTARAVARLPVLAEYLLPLARVGGLCIAMKGETATQEAQDARRALTTLGGTLRSIEEVELPGVEGRHYLVLIDKVRPTPAEYPRRPGLPNRSPLI